MWLLPFFMTKSIAASLSIRLAPRKDLGAPASERRGIEGQDRIYMYVEAVSYLLNSYVTDDVIAMAALKIMSLKKFTSQSAV